MMRVARSGYIEVPLAASSKIIDFPSHLWWCRLDRSTTPPTLVFEAKTTPYFDAEIQDPPTRTGLAQGMDDFPNRDNFAPHPTQAHVEDPLPYRAQGPMNP